ncbi:hypothetical protein [Leptolyngbya sp. PCC 6406]|uniref:hypothetical protein n=1 Tax=Leptolyngbya sp. PCC 6406 TaxID=1173264 RepID=UPI0003180C6C|nr:hypothetical protein [Leptolyngbya sp. PCC 6406]
MGQFIIARSLKSWKRIRNAGVPLRVIQEISGHRSLASLQRYLEVSPEQKKAAIAALGY